MIAKTMDYPYVMPYAQRFPYWWYTDMVRMVGIMILAKNRDIVTFGVY